MRITIEGASEQFERKLLDLLAEHRHELAVTADTEWTVERAERYLRSLPAGARRFAEMVVVDGDGYADADTLRSVLGKLNGPTVALSRAIPRGVREGWWPEGTRAPIAVVYDPKNPSWQKAIAYEMAEENVPVFRAAITRLAATPLDAGPGLHGGAADQQRAHSGPAARPPCSATSIPAPAAPAARRSTPDTHLREKRTKPSSSTIHHLDQHPRKGDYVPSNGISITDQLDPYEWSNEHIAAYEAAIEAVNGAVGAYSALISAEEAKDTPNQTVIDDARAAREQLAREREGLRSSNREQIAAARAHYAQLAREVLAGIA